MIDNTWYANYTRFFVHLFQPIDALTTHTVVSDLLLSVSFALVQRAIRSKCIAKVYSITFTTAEFTPWI